MKIRATACNSKYGIGLRRITLAHKDVNVGSSLCQFDTFQPMVPCTILQGFSFFWILSSGLISFADLFGSFYFPGHSKLDTYIVSTVRTHTVINMHHWNIAFSIKPLIKRFNVYRENGEIIMKDI